MKAPIVSCVLFTTLDSIINQCDQYHHHWNKNQISAFKRREKKKHIQQQVVLIAFEIWPNPKRLVFKTLDGAFPNEPGNLILHPLCGNAATAAQIQSRKSSNWTACSSRSYIILKAKTLVGIILKAWPWYKCLGQENLHIVDSIRFVLDFETHNDLNTLANLLNPSQTRVN